MSQGDESHEEEEDQEFSLEDLGAAYARAAAEHDPEAFAEREEESAPGDAPEGPTEIPETQPPEDEGASDGVVSPEAIIEAALFVGHPENRPLTEQRLASLMRDVSPEEVAELIDQLNESYRNQRQALRIVRDEGGFRMAVAPEVETVRRAFLGKVREARLSQAAVEVLSLVAYQPGVTAQLIKDQRGHDSGALLNQLVRRRLIEMVRRKPVDGGRPVPHYYPTERFLVLFGLESLQDLPQVEEANLPVP